MHHAPPCPHCGAHLLFAGPLMDLGVDIDCYGRQRVGKVWRQRDWNDHHLGKHCLVDDEMGMAPAWRSWG